MYLAFDAIERQKTRPHPIKPAAAGLVRPAEPNTLMRRNAGLF